MSESANGKVNSPEEKVANVSVVEEYSIPEKVNI